MVFYVFLLLLFVFKLLAYLLLSYIFDHAEALVPIVAQVIVIMHGHFCLRLSLGTRTGEKKHITGTPVANDVCLYSCVFLRPLNLFGGS